MTPNRICSNERRCCASVLPIQTRPVRTYHSGLAELIPNGGAGNERRCCASVLPIQIRLVHTYHTGLAALIPNGGAGNERRCCASRSYALKNLLKQALTNFFVYNFIRREEGIRTLDTLLAYTHFPGVRLRPLGHLSRYTL